MTQGGLSDEEHSDKETKQKIKWINTISIVTMHILALYSLFTVAPQVRWQTYLWGKWTCRCHFQRLITYVI